MSYYVWKSDAGLSKQFLYLNRVPLGMKHGAFTTGKPIKGKPIILPFEADKASGKELTDMVPTQFSLLIFSPKAVEFLEKFGGNKTELFPVEIKSKKLKSPVKDYKLANFIGLVNCLDRKHAKIQTFEDKEISYLEKYKVLANKVPKGLKVFRLGEFTHHLIADESLKKAWEAAGLTGAVFIATEKYQ